MFRIVWEGVLGHIKAVDGAQKYHPTQKPVKLFIEMIDKYTLPDDLILDPFLGSGTTLIAAHQLGRVCRGVEISPSYVAVCLQRFLDYTDIEPVLLRK